MLSRADVLDLFVNEFARLRRRRFPSRLSFRTRASVPLSGMMVSRDALAAPFDETPPCSNFVRRTDTCSFKAT
jgi:hypothetical protein